ncbi:MAG: hypothetical protein MUC83_06260 [Pirellula sp.]|nr:hypothetical protein [Pirellula sp.]
MHRTRSRDGSNANIFRVRLERNGRTGFVATNGARNRSREIAALADRWPVALDVRVKRDIPEFTVSSRSAASFANSD